MSPRIERARGPQLLPTLEVPLALPPAPAGVIGLGPRIERANDHGPVSVGRGRRGAAQGLPQLDGKPIRFDATGTLRVGGEVPATNRHALALYAIAQAQARGEGPIEKLSSKSRSGLLQSATQVLAYALARRPSELADKGYSGAMATLFGLAQHAPKREREVRTAALEQALLGLEGAKNHEQAAFYLLSFQTLKGELSAAQKQRLRGVSDRILPKRPLVEAYTQGRKRALEVRHTIHPEFWKEELRFFSKKNGFTLLKQNADDTRREYQGELKDPSGKNPPLKVHLVVKKDELDYLEAISDPKVHVILYSGHSALGGNGSQAIQAAGEMVGEHPKLVMAANCRGKDNYPEFTNKWPTAHAIMTEHPTYGPAGQARIEALFDTLARGESYGHMRKLSEEPWWDEPANNYFYPDELRKYRFMDADEDGKVDLARFGIDRVFDVDSNVAATKFHRALNFANSELFYHWEVDHEKGERSRYGKGYGDSLIANGALPDPRPNELVRVQKVPGAGPQKNFLVQYAKDQVKKSDQNVLAGHVTAHAVMALAKDRDGELTRKEALRATLMGAQAIHYLDVYEDSSPVSFRRFFKEQGLTHRIDEADLAELFEVHDAHANDAQLEAFARLLTGKYGVDLNQWTPQYNGAAVVV
ncbi:MAG: hypothetical protein IPG45_19160 [Deltaproteobacteria bacterium]|nr:hypothetical protein [Deltaproteobacteria bacterium]